MFITFEGGEGTGKTTLIKDIAVILGELHDVITTREPGGSMIAEAIRDIILNPKYKGVTPYTEALLLAASRAQHLDEVILPALKQNKIVLCDRYLDSSLAYQAHARGLGFDFVLSINKYATQNMPNLTFYIDLDPKVGISRISNREKYDRLDQETFIFHEMVREGYLKIAQMYPERMVTINGDQPIEVITNQIVQRIKEAL
ncbi:dTMP kinase [Peloplasma aerotolerans]|jgi:dTMP kinase|uniref:Thymidylate kinase n=1 Tax=Peloplasma aerotolerans TaxID=3044389 RepID=A0AAW6UAQ6_9MOLU|nr:dTMP kinase [Mariniplasma sp. M4Ah]MDI6453288.1 dTMP kinase [Mariniplasma sp. M4Ah]MDR4968485.1 dTMP kinase [Acholeplasmataceae bacterium]